jgi:hypothetical protein
MNSMRDGYDIRTYSASARKELLSGGNIDICKKESSEIIAVVPKLALVVISKTVRDYLVANPDTTTFFAQAHIEGGAVAHLIKWVNDIIRASDKKFGVPVPIRDDEADHLFIIQVRYAAQVLGMELYVRHFIRAYKESLRQRTPLPYEIETLQHLSHGDVKDDMVEALGERLGYLRRIGQFSASQLPMVQRILTENPKVAKAVQQADERAEAKHASRST